jgi:hypothetical protein
VSVARQIHYEASAPDDQDRIRRDLAAIEGEQRRLTEAIATSGGQIPILLDRLRIAEAKRRELVVLLERTQASRLPPWQDIERKIRRSLSDWRSMLTPEDIPRSRQALRQLLTTPVWFEPFVSADGYWAVRFHGTWGREAVLVRSW